MTTGQHDITDAVVIVTGAGTGIGAEACRQFSAAGARIVLVGRREQPLKDMADELGASRTAVVSEDLADPSAPESIAAAALAAFGQIDILVNNAGVTSLTPFAEIDDDEIMETYAVNLRAPLMLIKACLPALGRSPIACVVNVSSALGSMPMPNQLAYGASKAALDYATRALAFGLAAEGIRVNAVAPGPTDTPILGTITDDLEKTLARMNKTVVLGRVGQPKDLAPWIVLAATSPWVTGAVIPVDGGRILGPPPVEPRN